MRNGNGDVVLSLLRPRCVGSVLHHLIPLCMLQMNEVCISFAVGIQKDEKVWSYRPAPTLVYSWMLKHCCHLLALQDKQMAEMLTEFTMGVDIYLQNLRDVNKSDAKMRMVSRNEFDGVYWDLSVILMGHVVLFLFKFEPVK